MSTLTFPALASTRHHTVGGGLGGGNLRHGRGHPGEPGGHARLRHGKRVAAGGREGRRRVHEALAHELLLGGGGGRVRIGTVGGLHLRSHELRVGAGLRHDGRRRTVGQPRRHHCLLRGGGGDRHGRRAKAGGRLRCAPVAADGYWPEAAAAAAAAYAALWLAAACAAAAWCAA
uniref:Uncharacterized protein n=1 Tax=Anopheles atroparvus TaxID=41427 RepID=A0A182JA57_ANOAO